MVRMPEEGYYTSCQVSDVMDNIETAIRRDGRLPQLPGANFGWTSMDGIRIKFSGPNKYIIQLPDPVKFNEED